MTRDTLHKLVEELDEADLPTAARVPAALSETAEDDPLLRALRDAPLDDEPETEEERAEAAEARAETELIPHEEVKRQLGLVD